ncbi:MAG: TldD/PmbA family protein [Candidatus Stygibacter frigidus]|nr:TldD/PmbA family protein [Candidatus Stygibacter frigidus]
MFDLDLKKYQSLFSDYGELRLQKNIDSYININKSDVVWNTNKSSSGLSVRTGRGGIWGFSSSGEINDNGIKQCFHEAQNKLDWLAGKQQRQLPAINASAGNGEYLYRPQNRALKANEKISFLLEMDNYLLKKYPDLSNRRFSLISSDVEKKYINSAGGYYHLNRPLTHLVLSLVMNHDGDPISVYNSFSEFGHLQDNIKPVESFYAELDELYEHLRKKCEGIYAKPGVHDVVLDADLAGILSHEAIGHTTEADFVLKGSIAGDLLGKKVASELVTLVDVAHTYKDKLCPVPVFVDDEGTLAEDAVIIRDGVLEKFMHSRDTAQRLNMHPQGNARAYGYYDEPLVRMRNTMILPGTSKLEDMIADVDDGYYLIRSSNGQADTTSEFMFGVVLGYEIKNGKLGKAIRDMTISGVAFDVLKSVKAISKEYKFGVGNCGKKQQISVGMGGPAILCKVTIGGQQ